MSDKRDPACVDCASPLGAAFFGAGDGRGNKFRCEGCHFRGEADTLRTRLTTAERDLAEARAYVKALLESQERLAAEVNASDTTRREWEVRAAESWKVGRDVGRSTALADVTRCMTEVSDVPDDCAALVTLIADTIARADRESYATGRAAGLREAAEVCHAIKQENGDDPRVWLVDYMEECEQRILAIAPPAAETEVDRG